MINLNKANIGLIKNINTYPKYNIEKMQNTILHFGVGNFHRAHQAFFVHEIINANKDLSIIGINLRSKDTKEILEKQNYLYSLLECSKNRNKIHVINSIKKILYGHEDKKEIRKLISNSFTRIITITITEKGYCYDNLNKCLNYNYEIQNDFEDKNLFTLVGHLSYGLIERFNKNKEELYIISCDNLSNNGKILKTVILDFINNVNKNAASWVNQSVYFPSTMVDCIVPNSKKLANEIKLNYCDEALVICESYRDWYIENKDDYLKTILSHKDIKFVENVSFYEQIKLKMLNASHSAVAYIGLLLDYKYVHEVINNKICYKFINTYLEREVIPTILLEDQFDIQKYKKIILSRFKNKFLNHKLEQIGADGSFKIPIRIIDTYVNRQVKFKYNFTFIIIASWIYFLSGKTLKGNNYSVIDPNKNELMKIISENKNFIGEILKIKKIFDLSESDRIEMQKGVNYFYNKIEKVGLQKVLGEIVKKL